MKAKNSLNSFKIGIAKNEQMDCFDLMIVIGNFKSREEVRHAADFFAEWIAGDDGWKQKVQ